MLTPMSDELKNVSLSHATMRPEDLIPCFISALREIEADNAGIMADLDQMEKDMQADDYYNGYAYQYDLDYLTDLLNACSPDGFYFGAHIGDGSDYGFWECEE